MSDKGRPHQIPQSPEILAQSARLAEAVCSLLEDLESRFSQKRVGLRLFLKELDLWKSHFIHINKEMDQYFVLANKLLPDPIYCKSGCGNCCNHYVSSVEPWESLRIYLENRKSPKQIENLEYCHESSVVFQKHLPTPEQEDNALTGYFSENRPCVFFAEGNCSEYEVRPIACRMYYSMTPAEFCTPKWIETSQNKSFIHYCADEVELLLDRVSQYFAHYEISENLFEALLDWSLFEEEIQACLGET